MTSLLRELMNDGTIVLWHDYRSGSAYDFSLNNNNGTLSTGIQWGGPGGSLTFPNTTDEITVADSPELRLTEGSIIAVSETGFQSQTDFEMLTSHVTGGSGYQWSIRATGMFFSGDGVTRNLATTLTGSHSVGVTFSSGGTPVGYVDGVLSGSFSGAVTITGSSVATTLANYVNLYPLKSPLSAIIICNRILTATEMAQLHAELLEIKWPTKYYGHAKYPQLPNFSETGIVAGWDMLPVSGEVVDRIGGYGGTINGPASYKAGILGDSLEFNADTSYVNCGSDSGLVSRTDVTVMGWVRPSDITVGWLFNNYLSGADAWGVRYASNTIRLYDDIDNAGADLYTTSVNENQYMHFAAVMDGLENKLYLNGSLAGSGTSSSDNWNSFSGTFVLGARLPSSSFPSAIAGSLSNVRLYATPLSLDEIQSDYLKGAKAVQFKTDWAYQESPDNEGGVLHQQIGGGASLFRAGDTAGRWKIEYATVDGELCKVLTCTTTGAVYVPVNYFFDTTNTEAAYGTWDAWIYRPSGGRVDWSFMSAVGYSGFNPVSAYKLYWVDASTQIYETLVGSVVVGTPLAGDAWHNFRITRDHSNLFSLYVDGSSDGTGTDVTQTTSLYMVLYMSAGCKISLGSVKGEKAITKYLGVL